MDHAHARLRIPGYLFMKSVGENVAGVGSEKYTVPAVLKWLRSLGIGSRELPGKTPSS